MATKKRIAHLDLLKCFAIFMVLMGHGIQYLTPGDYCDKFSFRLIYSFHMPLFMAICGYFAWNTAKLSPANFIKKKFIQLLLPAFLYILIQICFIRPWGGIERLLYCSLQCLVFKKCFYLFLSFLHIDKTKLQNHPNWIPVDTYCHSVHRNVLARYNVSQLYCWSTSKQAT